MASESGVEFAEPASFTETRKRGSSRDERLGHIVDCAGSCCGDDAHAFVCRRAEGTASGQGSDPKDELAQNFLAEHEIGRRFHIDPNDLPAPKTGPIVTDRSLIVPYDGQVLQVPPSFTATPFATGLANPRRLLALPNGDVMVAEQNAGYLTLPRDDGEGRARWEKAGSDTKNR
jgi:hypothetical protein